jgi:signal transduction histidine kinase
MRLLRTVRPLQTPVLVAIAYYLAAHAAFWIGTLSDRIFAPFWPPNIVLFCTLLLVPKRSWWLYIIATFPAHVLAEVSVGMPPVQFMVAFATNCMVAILNAICVRRLLGGPPWFGTLWNASVYILVTAVVNPAVSAFGGAFVQILGGGQIDQYWWFWANWYISNALGSVTLGPVFLIWFSQHWEVGGLTRRRQAEALILGLSLVAVCAVAFRAGTATIQTGFLPAILYSPLPFILWAAIRFGERGASGAILVVTVVSISQNLNGSTVFITLDPEINVFALQAFLMGIAIPIFLLGAAIDELHRAGKRMRELAGTLLRAQDDERRRIARELHDSTGQNLVVASLMADQVQSMAPPSCGPVIHELNEVLQRSLLEIRTVSYLLHPPLLDDEGLSVALGSYVNGFSKRTGLHVDLHVSPSLERLPAEVELVLFRVVQEALTNVWRHSGSATAKIRLTHQTSHSGRQVTLTIEDAGKGMPDKTRSTLSRRKMENHVSSGLGMAGMRERLHQIGGRLEIDSSIGKTVIRAIVVVNQEGRQARAQEAR